MQKHIRFYLLYVFVPIIVLGLSCSSPPVVKPKNVIDFETEIRQKNYTIQKLSDYAESLRYVPLQTNDSSLIDGEVHFTQGLFYGHDHFIINDTKRVLRFNAQGVYMGEIAKRGQGPEEYVSVISIDIDYDRNIIYLRNDRSSLLEYTLEGRFLRRMRLERSLLDERYRPLNLYLLTPGVYVIDLRSYELNEYMFAFFKERGNTLELEHPVSDPEPVIKDMPRYTTANYFHRSQDELYYYDTHSDTVYYIGKDKRLSPSFTFQYGKYKTPRKESENIPDDPPYIELFPLLGTSNFFFMSCRFSIYASEPFMVKVYRRGEMREVLDTWVYAVFNKRSGRLHLLKQPEPGVLGLLNDIDNGVAFWPKAISADETEAVMLCPASDFIEVYSGLENPPPDVLRILQLIDEESNPVVIIAKLKQ